MSIDERPGYYDENGNADPDKFSRWLLARMQSAGGWSTAKEFAGACETDAAQLSRAMGGNAPVQAPWLLRLALRKRPIADLLVYSLCDLLGFRRPERITDMTRQEAEAAVTEAARIHSGLLTLLLPTAMSVAGRGIDELRRALGISEAGDGR